MTIRPIDIQVILGKLVDLSIHQQQLQNAPVTEQVKDEQVTQQQAVHREEQISQTAQTEFNRVDNEPGHGRGGTFTSARERKESEEETTTAATEEEKTKGEDEDPFHGKFIDVKR